MTAIDLERYYPVGVLVTEAEMRALEKAVHWKWKWFRNGIWRRAA